MCVIIYKPAGKELPSLDILDKAYRRNPHGCGIVSPNVLYKGLSYTSFKKNLKRCNKEEPLLIHFRYATHGSVKKSIAIRSMTKKLKRISCTMVLLAVSIHQKIRRIQSVPLGGFYNPISKGMAWIQ